MATRNRTGRRRSKGQSLPLIALMIVVLVAMVGLSVDVGNTFQEERQAVSAANAASIAGMNTVIRRGPSDTNRLVYESIINSLRANGVEIAPDGVPTGNLLRLDASYIDPQGKSLGTITPDGNKIPNNIGYIQVQVAGTVDTYFARVVGRSDLPIGASAYAGQCALGDGVYPIAVDKSLLDGTKFKKTEDLNGDSIPDANWKVIQSGPYRGYTSRQIFVHDGTQQPGSFGFLRWMEDTGQSGRSSSSSQELELSLTGFGNLAWGFEEAPEAQEGNGNQPADPNNPYPTRPGELNEGDWVYGTPGWKSGGNDGPIAEHIKVGTKMVLPIYDRAVGQGSGDQDGVRFHVVEFGSFVILDQNGDGGTNQGNGNGNGTKYFEMVYLGPALRQTTACQLSAVPPNDSDCCELKGDVSLWPEYQIIPNDTKPVQYMVVLDQSGSMSANFLGQCDKDGSNSTPPAQNYNNQPSRFWQCSNGPLYDTNGDGVGDTAVPANQRVTGTGTNYYWSNRDERRITVAKKALETLIRLTNMPGNAAYTTSYPDDQMALMWFTDVVQRSGNNETFVNGTAFTNQPDELVSKMWARTTGSDRWRTAGGTNGAAALYRAGLILDGAPKEIQHTNGKTYEYKQVVLFITDGVSNQFFHESRSDLRVTQSSSNTYSPGTHPCAQLGGLVIEDAECQTTKDGGVYTTTLNINGSNRQVGLDRPVTQAIKVSQDILQKNGYSVFVIALSDLPATGLASGVPSFPNYYRAVPNLVINGDGTTNVDTIVKDINEIVKDGICERGKDPDTTNRVTSGNFRPVLLPNNSTLNYPNVGIVTVRNSTTGQVYTTNIVADTDGKVSYKFAKVPPGIYSMTATLYYRHPNEPADINNRAYNDFWDDSKQTPSITVEVTNRVRTGSFLPSTQRNIDMRLRGNPCEGAGVQP